MRRKDELAEWTKKEFSFAFPDTKNNINVLRNYSELMVWANKQSQYTEAAKAEFARAENADPWLIAYTMLDENYVLVTQEVYKQNVKAKIPIPNVCKAFGVNFIDTFTLLRELEFRFRT